MPETNSKRKPNEISRERPVNVHSNWSFTNELRTRQRGSQSSLQHVQQRKSIKGQTTETAKTRTTLKWTENHMSASAFNWLSQFSNKNNETSILSAFFKSALRTFDLFFMPQQSTAQEDLLKCRREFSFLSMALEKHFFYFFIKRKKEEKKIWNYLCLKMYLRNHCEG